MEDSRKKLYDTLSKSYNLGTFEEFNDKMGYEESRKKLYDTVSEKYNLGDFDTFNQKMGTTYQADKEALEQQMDEWGASNGSFMKEYEDAEKLYKSQSVFGGSGAIDTPQSTFVYDNAQEYGKKRSEIEEMRRRYYSNPLVIKQREGDAEFARQMAEGFATEAKRVEQENPELARKAKAANAAALNPRGARTGYITDDVKQYNEDRQNYETARRMAESAQDIYAAPSKYDDSIGVVNFLKGGRDVANKADFWTMGMVGIADNLNARDALMKVQEKLGSVDDLTPENIDSILTPSEKAIVTAFATNVMAQASRANDLSRGYQAGQGAMESLGFMAQFLLTQGLGSAAAKGASKGIAKAVSKGATDSMTKWLAGQLGKISSSTVKSATKSAAKGVVGTIESVVKASVMTPMIPQTWKTVSDEMLEINDAGQLQEASTAFWHGLGDAMIETWSENAGGMVEKILGVPLSAGKSVWNKALGKTDFGKWGANLTRTPAYNLMKQAGWNGFIAEMGEEFVGNTVRTVTGLDPEALQDFTTVDNLLVTAASFAPMTIVGLGTSAAQYGAAKKRATKAAEHLAQVMEGAGYTPEQIAFTLDDMNASTPVQLSQSLTPVVNQIAKDSGQGSYVFKAAMEYADAMARYRTLDGFYNREQAAQIEDARENIMANTGQQFWQTKEVADGVTTDNVRVITTKEGIRMFVTGESEDGMLAVVKENGEKRFITPDQLANTAGPIPEGEVIVSDESMSLNDFLRSEVVSKKKDAEQQRMSEEANAAIETIRQAARPGTQINLGTAEVPVIGNIVQQIPDGVVVQSEAGVSQLTWEEAGNAMNIAVKPMTDAEIEQQEIDAIEAERAAKEFERAKTEQEAVQAGATEIVSTEEAEDALPLPLKADGSVDQTALWNQSPERWARWNDDQRQDDGINSANYISSALARAQKDLDQTVKAYGNESDFDARASLESDIAAKQERVNRLAALQQSYIPQEAMQEAQAEQTSIPAKPLSSQQLKEKQKPVERTLESEVAHLYELGLNNEEVAANLDAKIAKAQKDLEAQSKKAPLMEADAEAYIEKKRKYEEKMSALQQEADFWSEAKEAVHNLRAQETQMPEAPSEVALESDPEPQNGVELAARELGLREGGIKLLWDSLEHHTGYGSSERSKFFDLFRTKAKGGMTIEQAGERLMELDRENNTGFFDQNDPNAGTNAILDALSDNETIGQLRSYVARQRKAEAEREAKAAYSSMNAYYEQTFGEKLEDTALYDEIRSAEILASGLSESEQQELNNIIFAEEISQYGTEGYQTEASGVYESEVAGNATNVEPGAEGVRTESVGVLQGAQSDNSGRAAEPEEGQRGSEGESSEQDALPSVPSGESATAVESSLDEDMPDFSNQIEQVREEVDTDPSEAQKKAGNYKMGHLHLDGYNITIENPKGSVRRGTDSKGNEWENTLNNDYGYIRGTEGVDGDHIDVYLSDNPAEGNVYVIDQVNPETREFDEHKVMYGFNSIDEAREAYLANFSEGWNGLGTITEVTKDEFRKWIDSSHRKTKPFSEYKSVKPESAQSSKAQLSDEEVTRKAVEFFTPGSKALALRERIDSWVSKLGVNVNVMESIDDVKNAQAKALIKKGGKVWGWFESATGEVYIYLPDFASLDLEAGLSEIDKTYIHEIVSHQGLRGLLGEDKYSELCDMVWNALDEDQKNRYLNYPGVNGNTRAAADEFIAHFAENVDYYGNRTLWDKIVDFIKDLLRFNNKIEISNAKLANLLRQSYARLAKNAAATNVNQQAEGNTVFRAADGSLVGMHNISEEKLRKAIKQGGSANPSTAVIDIERQSFNSYGEISFIMPSSLVDAGTGRNAGTFTADAWTPTYPHVTKRFSDDKLQRAYWRDVSAIPEEMSHEVRMAFDSWLDDRNASGLAYMFLHERGEAPEMVRVAAKFPQDIKDKVSAILGENRSELYELSDEEKQAMLELYIQENFGGNREEFDKSIADRIQRIEDRLSTGKVPSFVEKRITLDLQWMKEHAYDYDELSKFVSAITADIRHAGEVNDAATTNRALDYIKDNGLEKEFDKWKESLNDRYGIKEYLFDGYTPSGNQRWLPNTVENASRLMNKQGLAGATGIAASFSRFVATLAPKKKTLSDIRASKGRLVEDEKLVDDFREKWSEVFFDLGVKCQPDAKGYEDYGLARLTEAAQKKNPGAYLKKEYGVELSQDDLRKLDEMIKAIKTEFPAGYFETKFQRPVYLNEFAAAVMPTTTSEDIKQAVSEAGLPIFEYDSAVEGSRKEATLKATEGEGIRFRTTPSDRVLSLFNQAKSGELKGKPVKVGALTKEGKAYLEGISGIKLKDNVSFVLNPSDLNHIYNDHYGQNEKDTGNNIPLNDYDIRRLVDVIAFPTNVIYGNDTQGRKVFYFLSETPSGTYNLMEVYANKKGNLTAKTYYKTKKGATQRVMELESLLSTSETYSGATLSDAKIPILFDITNQEDGDIRFRATEITPEVRDEMDRIAATAIIDGNYMLAQNGRPTKLTADQWAMVRTKGFKRWFGDWEKAARIQKLRDSEPVILKGNEYEGKYELNRDSAQKYILNELRDTYTIADTKERIRIVKKGAKKVTSHSMGNDAHMKSIAIIPEIIRSAIFITELPADKADAQYDSYRYYVCGLEYAGENYTVKMTVGVKNGDYYYDHTLTDIEKGKLLDMIESQQGVVREGFTPTGNESDPSYALSDVKDRKLVSILQNNSSKVVDENGEPRVMYHGSAWQPLNEPAGQAVFKMNGGILGEGAYFASSLTEATMYAEMATELDTSESGNYEVLQDEFVTDYFLNIRNAEDIMDQGDGEIIAVAKSPSQIKSATDNTGEFSAEEGDIRFRAEEPRTDPFPKRGDSSELMADALPQTSETTLDNTSFDGKDSDYLDNNNSYNTDDRFRTTIGTPTEDIVENGLQLSVQNYARLAGDIFAALPENMRREVVEDTFRNGIDMQRAIMQIPTRLAEKDDLSEVEVEVAKMIAGKVQDALLADGVLMTRPLTTAEAIWMLYKHNNAGNDILSAARRSVAADNLGFSNGIIGGRFSNEDDIRFRASRAARADSAARMYNTEARLAWRRLQESWQDMNVSVDSLMRALETASGKAIQAFENIAMALNRLSSKNLADKKKFLRDKLMPLWEKVLEISDKFKVSIEDIERYMMLKHGLERNLVLAARDARNYYKEELEKELSRIDKDSSLSKSEKKAAKAKAEATYQRHLKNIENGTDSEYLENRKKDYGGLTSLYSDYADYGTREDYDTEEEYQEAAKAARTPKYKTLEKAENAAVAEVGSFEAKIGGLTMELWHKVNAATKDTLKHQYNHGMLTKEQYESVRDMFEYYVPLRGFKDNTVEDMYSYYGSGQHNDFAKPLQAAKGRKTEAESPLGWIGSMAESAIQMDNKNDAKLRLYYLAVNRQDNDLMKITETWYEWTGDYNAEGKKIFEPVYPTFSGHLSGDSMQAKMDAFDSMMEQQAMQGNAFRGKQRIDIKGSIIRMPKTEPEHVVNVKVAGKDYSILINGNPRAAQAINGLLNIDNADANGVYRGFRAVLRMMSALSTSYNPEFWISNFQRDMMYAFIGTSIRHDKAYTAEFAKNYIEAFKVISMLRKNKKGALGTSETESYYKEFSENGGVTGYTVLVNNAEYDKMLREFQKDQQKSDFIKKVKSGFEAVADFGEAIEQVSRFAAYMTSRKMGKGIEESVNEAKEITVNFNRKGSGKAISWEEAGQLRNRNGKPLNWAEKVFFVTASGLSPIGRSVYMFFNASIQGLSAAAKLARNNPKKSAVWAGIFLSMGMLNAVLHAMLDDDDDYLDMPEYEKRTNLLIGGNGVYFKWALPQEVRPFYAMADIFVNHAMGRAPHKNITEELASVFADLLPVNTVGAEGLEGVTGALMPSYVSPIYQVIINKDFKGAPIYREMPWIPDDQQKDVPAYTKAYSGTGSLYVNVSEMLNNLSGGDYSKAGAININPAVVEHIVEGYGGGTLTTANKVLKSLGMIAGTEDISFRSMPFLSRILTVNDDRYRNAHTTELYNYYKGISDQAKRSYNAYEKQRDGDKLSELMRSEDWKVHQIFVRYKKMLDYYDKQLKLASTEDERRTIMREQDAQRKRVIEEISRLR